MSLGSARGAVSAGRIGYAILRSSGALALWRWLVPGRIILAYHNVIAAGEYPRAETALHLPADRFERQLKWVANRFDVVALGELLDGLNGAGHRERLAAITFDDAYRGVFRNAAPLLERLRLPATVFVVTEAAESGAPFWWDLVAEGRPDLDRKALRNRWRGEGSRILSELGDAVGAVRLPEEYLPADWETIAKHAGLLEVGAHTVTHPMLTALPADALDDELHQCRIMLRDRIGVDARAIAYPYGDWNLDVAEAARRAGYRMGLTSSGGRVLPSARELQLPRVGISASTSPAAFAAAASGLRWRR